MIDPFLNALPAGLILPPTEIPVGYLGDWACRNEGAKPIGLAKPRSTDEVRTLLKLCHAHRTPLVVQGGRTGLSGGATPQSGWLILSMERMNAIESVDVVAATMTAQAGATLASVQTAADARGLLFPLDIGSRGSCTLGGNIATNAGGNRVLRYGMMREQVYGLEAVLADGTVLAAMNGMQKNNTGYDLKQLFIGAEGTLGVVTRAVLRLVAKPSSTQTALCAVSGFNNLLRLLASAKERLGADLAAFEVMWPLFYRLGTDGLGFRAPLDHGHDYYVLVESAGTDSKHDLERFQNFVESALAEASISNGVVAQSIKEARELWRVRDSSGELQRTFWPYVGFDVSIPIRDIGRFVADCEGQIVRRWRNARTLWFGHLADSNLHICVRLEGVEVQPEEEFDILVYDCVKDYAGSISAEHGIGLLKLPFLDRSRSRGEIDAMRTIKRALDPQNILNPGKIF